MTTSSTRAYREIANLLLSPRDQEKFEWSVGCMLDNGPCHVVVLLGDAGTGKTTLMTIARKILLSPFTGAVAPRAAFITWVPPRVPRLEEDTFYFVESNTTGSITEDAIVIKTTGDRVPVNKHYVLTREIDNELVDIADRCIALYRELGEDYYHTFEENN